jgi:hypothetical protein
LRSINPDVMIFLLGMFITGEAMHRSGFLLHLSYRLFGRARSLDHLVLLPTLHPPPPLLYERAVMSALNQEVLPEVSEITCATHG